MITTMLLLIGTPALSAEWPDLQKAPPKTGDGSRDAALIISAGDYIFAPDTQGEISCWGDGQSFGPNDVFKAGTFVSVSAGYLHTCAVDEAGEVSCWGYNQEGQVSEAP